MSRERSPSKIFIALFLAFLISALPAGTADTPAETTVATVQTTVTPEETTVAVTTTTVVPPETTATTAPATVSSTPTTAATTPTTVPPTQTTAAPATTPSPAATPGVTLPAATTPAALTTPPVTPAVTTGSLAVYSSPPGAGILIDGIYSGTTPKTVQGIPAGNHILRLTLSGYHDYEGSVYIIAGQMAQGYGTLQPAGAPVSPALTPVIVPVVVPVVTDTPVTAEDSGILGNSGVVAAVIGAISVIIVSVAKVYTHIRPPKKEG